MAVPRQREAIYGAIKTVFIQNRLNNDVIRSIGFSQGRIYLSPLPTGFNKSTESQRELFEPWLFGNK